VNAIRKSLKDGLLGNAENVRASRTKAGPFEALTSYPEFRDLLGSATASGISGGKPADPAPVPAAAPRSSTGTAANRPATPTSSGLRAQGVPRPAPSNEQPPHIVLPPAENPGMTEVIRWGFLALVAVVTALVAYWLVPWFTSSR
jgi:hypothetical protein